MSATKITQDDKSDAAWPKRADVSAFVGFKGKGSLRVAFETSGGSVTAAYANFAPPESTIAWIRMLMLRANAIMDKIRESAPRFGERSILRPVVVQERRRAGERRETEIRARDVGLAAALAGGAAIAGGALYYALRGRATRGGRGFAETQTDGPAGKSVATQSAFDEPPTPSPPTPRERAMRAILTAVLLKLATEWAGYENKRRGDAESVIIDRAGIRCLLDPRALSSYVFTSVQRLLPNSSHPERLDGGSATLAKLSAWDARAENSGEVALAYEDRAAWCFVRSVNAEIVELLFAPPDGKELSELTDLDDLASVCGNALRLALGVTPEDDSVPSEFVLKVRMLVFCTLVDSERSAGKVPIWSTGNGELTWSAQTQIGDTLVVANGNGKPEIELRSSEGAVAVRRVLSQPLASMLLAGVPKTYPNFVRMMLHLDGADRCEKCNSSPRVLHVMLPCGHVLCASCAEPCGCEELYKRSKRHRKCARHGCGCGEQACGQATEPARCVCPWSKPEPEKREGSVQPYEGIGVCTSQLATPSKLRRVSSGDATHDYRVPLSEIRERWNLLAPRWGRVSSEEHQSALAAVDIALSYPAFLRSFRDKSAAPRSTSVTLHFPTYSATVAVDVAGGKLPVDKHGVWRATYDRDGLRTELARDEAPCGKIWSNQVHPQCGLEHPRLETEHKVAWIHMSWRIMCLCREVDRYSPFSYRFRLDRSAQAADGLIISPDHATVTLRKPMSKENLTFRVGSVLRIQQLGYPTSSFLRVVGMVIEGGALRAIRFERWSQSGSAWTSWPAIPMLQPTYPKSQRKAAWCWDWQGAELAVAAPETVPEANFGRRFV
jgi:hypothetical protein